MQGSRDPAVVWSPISRSPAFAHQQTNQRLDVIICGEFVAGNGHRRRREETNVDTPFLCLVHERGAFSTEINHDSVEECAMNETVTGGACQSACLGMDCSRDFT